MPPEKVHDYCLIDTQDAIPAQHVLFVGTPNLYELGYRQVREFANRGLSVLGEELPNAKHIAMTVHGVNSGLDGSGSLLAQFAGLVDVLQAWQAPRALEKISIVEFHADRAERIQSTLKDYFDEVHYAQRADGVEWAYDLTFEREMQVDTPDAGSDNIKPYAIALFPEDPALEDDFFYGVERPVHAMGLLCERMSIAVNEAEKSNLLANLERIKTATAVICDVSDMTPLLYVQLGYAWGSGVPTALITRNADKLLGTQATVQYEKIWQLEERLAQWLKGL